MLQCPKHLSLSAVLALGLSGMAASAGAESTEQDSVHSWGRWEVLAPAAGGVPTVSALPVESGVELRPGEATKLTPEFRTVEQNGGGSEPPAEGPLPPITDVNPDEPVVDVPPPPPPAPAPPSVQEPSFQESPLT